MQYFGVIFLCRLHHQFIFPLHISGILYKSSQLCVSALTEVTDRMGDIVRGKQRHHFTGRHDHHIIGISAADRHGEPAAYHIAKHVVKHDIWLKGFIGVKLLQLLERRDYSSSGTSDAGSRAS